MFRPWDLRMKFALSIRDRVGVKSCHFFFYLSPSLVFDGDRELEI